MKCFSVPMLFCFFLTWLLHVSTSRAQTMMDPSMMAKEFAKAEDILNSI